MTQCIRTTVSFSEEATNIINAMEPANLSDFVSKAVEYYYREEGQVIRAQYEIAFDKTKKLLLAWNPSLELKATPKATE